jgi:hypoxanthine-DNA glycosylase
MRFLKEIDPEAPCEDRKEALLGHRIALWDVLESCLRTRSSNNKIRSQKPNDLQSFLKGHPKIKVIFLNGRSAKNNLPQPQENRYDVDILPSSSGSNTYMTIA